MAHDYDRSGRSAQVRTAEYKGEGQEMFELFDAKWSTVHYDEEKASGWADTAIGKVEFEESGNDPAVWVTITKPLKFKGRPEDVMKSLEAIKKAIDIY
jgi:hypothetical protein